MEIAIALLVAAAIIIIIYLFMGGSAAEEVVLQDRLRNMSQTKNGTKSTSDYWKSQMRGKSLKDRLITPAVEKFTEEIKKLAPESIFKVVEKDIEASGNFDNRGLSGFLMYELLMTVGMVILAGLYVYTRKVAMPIPKAVIIVCLAGMFGFAFPIILLKSMIAERKEEIRREMPDVLDLLCVSVQAGMGFDGAMGKVTAKMKGPLIDECDRLLQELRMGVTRRNALLRLAERCGIKEMQLFAAALIQAEKLGVGLAQVLEIQSENMRELRRQRAREIAAKMPTKILFPLLMFIFPVIFVVALGPPLVTIVKAFAR